MRVPALAYVRLRTRAGFQTATIFLLIIFQMSPALGQQPPPRISPDELGRRIDSREAERRIADKPAPRIQRPNVPQPHGSSAPLVVLNHVTVEGATAVSSESIGATYRDYIGQTVSQNDLLNIATAISDLYRAAGYHLSRAVIPPQDIKSGNVVVKVIEGSVEEVQIKARDAKRFDLESYFKGLPGEHPSKLSTVERSLLLANDVPGVRISDAAFEEIGSATGKFRLIVSAETWDIYGSVGIDNAGTYAAGPLQAYSFLAANSALIAGDALGVSVSTVPNAPKDLRYGRATYDLPVGNDGARIGASASMGEVRPDDLRRQLNARTISQGFELRGSIVPIQGRDFSLTFAAVGGITDEKSDDDAGLTYQDHVRTVALLADAKLHDILDGWNYLTLGLKRGIDAFGATRSDDPLASRTSASPDFAVYTFAYSRYQPLLGPWSAVGKVSGQLASGPLLSSQSFFLGDPAFGPGYYSGDNGITGSVELRFSQVINWQLVKSYQIFGLVDAGTAWNNNYGDRVSLASAGAGVRFELIDDWRGSASVAVPISYSSKSDEFHGTRALFSLSKSFKLCTNRQGLSCSDPRP